MPKDKKKSLRAVIYINILLVLLLTASIIIFLLILQPIYAYPFGKLIYAFIIFLSILTAITGIMVFTILSKKKIV